MDICSFFMIFLLYTLKCETTITSRFIHVVHENMRLVKYEEGLIKHRFHLGSGFLKLCLIVR
ncbi:hypothetical protein KC19_4G090100 [Ceratodon purpureus]|uniref:Uncharacterized protein n=1 Tax=Ceratodon purpureus TaxID=3225 RepID=A0A8T0IA09_CERPU|nr:hypothetical protein KC19_4G090100 [Ceratodon purpureus]